MLGFISPTRNARVQPPAAVQMVAKLQEGGPGTVSPRAESHRPHWLISHQAPSAAPPMELGECPRGGTGPGGFTCDM